MGIKKCESCSYQFKWKEIQRISRWGYKPLVCKKCGREHRITFLTRLVPGLLFGLIIFYIFSNVSSAALGFTLVVLVILLSIINILIFPYYAKYKAIHNHK